MIARPFRLYCWPIRVVGAAGRINHDGAYVGPDIRVPVKIVLLSQDRVWSATLRNRHAFQTVRKHEYFEPFARPLCYGQVGVTKVDRPSSDVVYRDEEISGWVLRNAAEALHVESEAHPHFRPVAEI